MPNYKLAGLIELDDTYVGGPKPGKLGRGAAGKSKVVVAVEIPGEMTVCRDAPGTQGKADEMRAMAQACLAGGSW